MKSTFDSCYQLTKLNLSNFDTSKVKDMKGMFFDCQNLKDLDLSSFKTKHVLLNDMKGMFMRKKNDNTGYEIIPGMEKYRKDKRFQKVAFKV